jgi:hypothetical protein
MSRTQSNGGRELKFHSRLTFLEGKNDQIKEDVSGWLVRQNGQARMGKTLVRINDHDFRHASGVRLLGSASATQQSRWDSTHITDKA